MGETIEFDDSLGIKVKPGSIFQDRSTCNVIAHLVLKLPLRPNLFLLRSEELNVFLDLLAEQNLLQAD